MTREKLNKIAKRYAQDELKDNHSAVEDVVAAAFLNGIDYAENHPHWISVEDELPEKREDVLVFTSQKSIQIAQLRYPETADWWDNDGRYMQNNKPTHWMPMPQQPAVISSLERAGKNRKEKKGGEE